MSTWSTVKPIVNKITCQIYVFVNFMQVTPTDFVFKRYQTVTIIIIHNSYILNIAPNPTRLAQSQSTSQFKTRMDIRINTWNMHVHQTIQRQQQSAGKHAHIPEQSVQPRHAMQQYMDYGNISWLQIRYKEHQKLGSAGRFGRTTGFSTVT